MIPKIIHYCWFGGKEKSEEFSQLFEGWKKLLPDYEFKEWNESNFDVNELIYSREAYKLKDYAHVSDVCRVYALYKYGGVYIDTDVELLKSFDPYLTLKSFLGVECDYVGTCVIGSLPKQLWVEKFLDYYKKTHFVNIWGHAVRTPNPLILTKRVFPSIRIVDYPTIFPIDYFCGINLETNEKIKTPNTVSIHHFAASWRYKKTFSDRIRKIIKGLKIRYLGS